MHNNTESLNKGIQKVITYGQVMNDLNYIAKTSGDDVAYFDIKLKDVNNKTVCGFVFKGLVTGLKLSQLMDKLNIKYSHYYPVPTPTQGELHIDPQDAQRAKDLFANWTSWITIERRLTGNKEIDSKWAQIVSSTYSK